MKLTNKAHARNCPGRAGADTYSNDDRESDDVLEFHCRTYGCPGRLYVDARWLVGMVLRRLRRKKKP